MRPTVWSGSKSGKILSASSNKDSDNGEGRSNGIEGSCFESSGECRGMGTIGAGPSPDWLPWIFREAVELEDGRNGVTGTCG